MLKRPDKEYYKALARKKTNHVMPKYKSEITWRKYEKLLYLAQISNHLRG